MKKHKITGNVLIDLTSLLDIVFIVLLVVLCRLQGTENELARDMEYVKTQQEETQVKQELYDDQIAGFEDLEEYLSFISVNAHFDEDLITRHISIMNSDKGSEIPEITELKGTSVSEGYSDLKDYLEKYVMEDPDRVVVLSLNEGDEDILYRDEKEIQRIFNELSGRYPNIRQK